MKHATKAPWLRSLAVLGLLISCAGSPKTQALGASAAQAPEPAAESSPPIAAARPAPDPRPELPALSETRHRPLPSSFLVLSLPEPGLPKLAEKLEPAAPVPVATVPSPAAKAAAPSPAAPALAAPALVAPTAAPVAPPAPASVQPAPVKPSAAPAAPAKPAPAKPDTAKSDAAKAADAKAADTKAAAAKAAAAAAAPSSLPPPGPASTIQSVTALDARKPDIARTVTVDLGQRIELAFEGSGWTYLGETEGREGILYESRRYEGPGLTFVLNTSKTGDFVLRFQSQDLLRATTNEELVAVKVNPKPIKPAPVPEAPASVGAATAAPIAVPATTAGAATAAAAAAPAALAGPGSAASSLVPAAPPPQAAQTPQPAQAPQAQGQVSALAQPQASSAFASSLPDSPDGLLLAARKELLAGRVSGALTALDRFLSLYPEGMDEVYYLYGLSLEQNGETKDIKKAYASYKKVVDSWPESQFWDQAMSRMAFLERHYLNIR